ncbi:MAG: GC-type dockerin domain-anchored protein [Phycisphaerales bacterium]
MNNRCSLTVLGTLLALALPSAAQPTNPPVTLEGPFGVACDGDFFNDPFAKCFPESWLGSHVRLRLNTFLSCPTGIEGYDGIDNASSQGTVFTIADDGSTGSGLVDFAMVNTARGSMNIDYGSSRVGPGTDVVATLTLEGELTTDNLGQWADVCAAPDDDGLRSFDGRVELNVVLLVDQPVVLTDRSGAIQPLQQFAIGDIIPPGSYSFQESISFGGSGNSPDEVVVQLGVVEFTMPDCNTDGISDLTQIDTDGNGTPDACEPVQNLSAGTGYASLQQAVNAAAPFDELAISAGVLNEFGVFISKPLTIRGVGMDTTVIDAQGVDRCLFIAGGALGVEITDLTLINGDSFVVGELGGNAIVGSNSQVTFRRVAFRDGRSTNGNTGGVAGFGLGTSIVFEDCEFTANHATFDGGAITLYNTVTAEFIRCLFEQNAAGFSGGAAVLFDQSAARFEDCSFIGNEAGSGGGIAQIGATLVELMRCEFRGNSAAGGGAAHIAFVDDTLFAANTLFAGGIAQGGAAVQLQGNADATLLHCTAAGNTAFNTVTVATPENALTAIGCIFWGNSGFNGPVGPGSALGDIDLSRCIFPEATASNIALDPLFVNPQAGDYSIRAASPAIDAADPLNPSGDAFDLAGLPRLLDDGGIPGVSEDIGAYEFQGTTCLPDTNGDGQISPADFTAWVVTYNGGSPIADQNRDGVVSPADFTAWVQNYNLGC